MHGKYNYIIILLFINIFIFSQDTKKISIIRNLDNLNIEKQHFIADYFIDKVELSITEKYSEFEILYNNEKFTKMNIKQISNKILLSKEDGFFLIDASNDQGTIKFNIKFYTSSAELIYNDEYFFLEKISVEEISEENIRSLNNIFFKALDKYSSKKNVTENNISKHKTGSIFAHDFPYVSISLNILSLKMYFDGRTITKMFSFFPIDLKLLFFPLKYLETGAFIRFNVGDMVYKYYDLQKKDFNYYESSFDFSYGIFTGFSYFGDIFHYSIGMQFFNIFYDLNNSRKYQKDNTFNSFFLPQVGLYQRIDIKILKIFYFTIFFNLKTLPMFYLDNNFFYSKPFNYDFINAEFSFVGFSIIF